MNTRTEKELFDDFKMADIYIWQKKAAEISTILTDECTIEFVYVIYNTVVF